MLNVHSWSRYTRYENQSGDQSVQTCCIWENRSHLSNRLRSAGLTGTCSTKTSIATMFTSSHTEIGSGLMAESRNGYHRVTMRESSLHSTLLWLDHSMGQCNIYTRQGHLTHIPKRSDLSQVIRHIQSNIPIGQPQTDLVHPVTTSYVCSCRTHPWRRRQIAGSVHRLCEAPAVPKMHMNPRDPALCGPLSSPPSPSS